MKIFLDPERSEGQEILIPVSPVRMIKGENLSGFFGARKKYYFFISLARIIASAISFIGTRLSILDFLMRL